MFREDDCVCWMKMERYEGKLDRLSCYGEDPKYFSYGTPGLGEMLYLKNNDRLFVGNEEVVLSLEKVQCATYLDTPENRSKGPLYKEDFHVVKVGKEGADHHLAVALLERPYFIPRLWKGKRLLFPGSHHVQTRRCHGTWGAHFHIVFVFKKNKWEALGVLKAPEYLISTSY
jgi:hypothetical protein